jgi:hypothetical protein
MSADVDHLAVPFGDTETAEDITQAIQALETYKKKDTNKGIIIFWPFAFLH